MINNDSLLQEWNKLKNMPNGTIYENTISNIKIAIKKNDSCCCAYIGIPQDHILAPYARKNYLPISVHSEFSFIQEGTKEFSGYLMLGWNYGHFGDQLFNEEFEPIKNLVWTLDLIKKDLEHSVREFLDLEELAEFVYKNGVTHGLNLKENKTTKIKIEKKAKATK